MTPMTQISQWCSLSFFFFNICTMDFNCKSLPASQKIIKIFFAPPPLLPRTSLVAQMVKNPPGMWETWVRFLGWEDPLEKSMAPTPVFLPGESPWTEEPGGLQFIWGRKESDMTERLRTVYHYY